MKYKIYNEDAVEWAKHYNKKKFHALLCDPPYHLSSIVKRFGKDGSAPAKYGTDGAFSRASAGFMGKTWDGGDVAFDPETWAAFGELLYPGAFGMAFSASRNWHRLAVAIEDAGFIIHPSLFCWLTAQGFPKATRVKGHKEFDGHRYGLQALKPSVEPIIVFQRPYDGRPLDNIIQTGAGALNIDGGRIGVSGGGTLCNNRDKGGNCLGHPAANGSLGGGVMRHEKLEMRVINRFTDGAKPWGNGAGHEYESEVTAQGRWPSNFILGSDEAARRLDEQSGIGASHGGGTSEVRYWDSKYGDGRRSIPKGDSGGASRFFFRVREQLDEADPVRYQAKASRSERDAGLDGFDEKRGSADYRPNDDGTAGIQSRLHGATIKGHNPHPTVKPLALAKYLAMLLLPPAEYAPRRILVPFSGVGSEMIGAGLAGWEQVVGVEFDTESNYVEIAKARIDYWCGDENPSV